MHENGEGASDVQHVVVDANVFLSFFIERNAKQRAAAKALLLSCEEGELVAVVPQFVIFEIVYVLQSSYGVKGEKVAAMVRDLRAFPGVRTTDDCPWRRILEFWPARLPSIADAAIVAVAASNRYDAVATFDQQLGKRLKDFGVAPYW